MEEKKSALGGLVMGLLQSRKFKALAGAALAALLLALFGKRLGMDAAQAERLAELILLAAGAYAATTAAEDVAEKLGHKRVESVERISQKVVTDEKQTVKGGE